MPVEGNFLGWDDLIRFGTVSAVVWSAAWFLFNQQIKIKDLVHEKFAELKNFFSDKLEYHERHDDQRFDNLNKELITIRIDQARSSNRLNKYVDVNGNEKNVNSS